MYNELTNVVDYAAFLAALDPIDPQDPWQANIGQVRKDPISGRTNFHAIFNGMLETTDNAFFIEPLGYAFRLIERRSNNAHIQLVAITEGANECSLEQFGMPLYYARDFYCEHGDRNEGIGVEVRVSFVAGTRQQLYAVNVGDYGDCGCDCTLWFLATP